MEPNTLAPHVLKALAQYQLDGRCATLQTLVDELKIRRADVRRTVSALDNEGYLDAMRMRLTMTGFALGSSFLEKDLPPLRRPKLALVAA